jgi:hypothetical protein
MCRRLTAKLTHSVFWARACLSHANNCYIEMLDLYFVTCFTGADTVRARAHSSDSLCLYSYYITFIGCAIICAATCNGTVI